jgi:hypothetical protein
MLRPRLAQHCEARHDKLGRGGQVVFEKGTTFKGEVSVINPTDGWVTLKVGPSPRSSLRVCSSAIRCSSREGRAVGAEGCGVGGEGRRGRTLTRRSTSTPRMWTRRARRSSRRYFVLPRDCHGGGQAETKGGSLVVNAVYNADEGNRSRAGPRGSGI